MSAVVLSVVSVFVACWWLLDVCCIVLRVVCCLMFVVVCCLLSGLLSAGCCMLFLVC